jgi:serine palmitoyltransferase
MAKPVSMLSPVNSKKQQTQDEPITRKRSATEQLTSIFQRQQQKALKTTPTSTPLSTPALSLHSILTSSSDETELETDEGDSLQYPSNAAAPTSEQTDVPTTRHSEFGHCTNETYRYLSVDNPTDEKILHTQDQEPSYMVLLVTYYGYLSLIVIGHIRDFLGKMFHPSNYSNLLPSNGYAALNSDFDSFYTRRLKRRLDDCFSRPVTGVPGRTIVVLDRKSEDRKLTFNLTGTRTRALNVSSYNYLGFAQGQGGCSDAVEAAIRRYGIASLGSRYAGGSNDLLATAESLVARFVGMESAAITSIGFATNSTNIPALVSKGCLVISDELNHASIRTGVRLSSASVRMFRHNDMNSLEKLLREVISQGQPRTHRPWKKILVIVEGLYSMEGTMCPLPKLLELKKKYKVIVTYQKRNFGANSRISKVLSLCRRSSLDWRSWSARSRRLRFL